jgi:nucleotide sugar dehydrogenase
MTKKIVGIAGYGYVGKAVASFFKNHYEVRVYDPLPQSSDDTLISLSNEKKILDGADLIVICVPTPMKTDGACDTSMVEDSIASFNAPLFLIKSTIPPGTTKAIATANPGKKIAFSPEYIGEGNYAVPFWKGYPDPTDMKKHNFIILGGEKETTHKILQFFKRVMGTEVRYFQTDSTTAELCKYMENAFLATKVTFCNEFYDIASTFGVDYDELRELWLLDERIGRSHSTVFENARGFGGKCLPKDVSGIFESALKKNYTPALLKAVLEINKGYQSKNS